MWLDRKCIIHISQLWQRFVFHCVTCHFLEVLHNDFAEKWRQNASHSHFLFLLVELTNLKVHSFQSSSSSAVASTHKTVCSANVCSLCTLFPMNCMTSLTCTLVKRLTTSKNTGIFIFWMFTNCSNCIKCSRFVTKDCDLPTTELSILCRKPARV